MKHIVIDARNINSENGIYVVKLLLQLQQKDKINRYTVLLRKNDSDLWQPAAPNFEVCIAEFDSYSFAEQFKFKRFLDKLSPDLVHFCAPEQPVFYRGKKITTIHNMVPIDTLDWSKEWWEYYTKSLVNKFMYWVIGRTNRFIITPSDYIKNAYVGFAGINKKKVVHIYNGSDNEATVNAIPYKTDFKKYLLYVGAQDEYKNVGGLIEAHRVLLKKLPDLGLILVGNEDEAIKFNKDYLEYNKFKNIHFTGTISDGQCKWLYQNTAAYVFPSTMEGFGLQGLEAMKHGAPLVSSDAACLPEVYGDAAHYFDPTDIDDMARTIEDVLNDKSLRKKLIKKGYNQTKKYSWKRMAEETLEIYNRVLK